MYLTLSNRLRAALARYIQENYKISLDIVLDRPPKIEMGEAASPVCFELAKRLKKAPRIIAQEIANGLGEIEGVARVEVAGAGYLNFFFDRAAFWRDAQREAASHQPAQLRSSGKVIVEHTSINPNKAAHIGHVRNAVLGDTMARILRHAGHAVQVQNYIDNTGVQVADVVIGFLDMERLTPVSVKMAATQPRFDYFCWDLYAKVTHFLEEDKLRAAELRARTLKAIEEDRGEEAEVAQVVADTIVSLHLKTMARLGISYELLARESEILHLKFWDAAFELLKESGVVQLVSAGKMAGCWIIPWKEESRDSERPSEEKPAAAEDNEENIQDKIIVRSNGTVTYVGKDIAYQFWKFGLLGKDFNYRKWPAAPEGETVWATTTIENDPAAPHFAEAASAVYNVIDTRQSYVQDVVAEALRRLGHAEAADKSIHLSYAFVVLTPRCAAEMGYELSPEDAKRPFVDMSGRKGFGVKADDLIDNLEAATLAEVQQRHAEMTEAEQRHTARVIAVGALRFFLLKFTRNAIIAFDFKDALSFEGETGPYCQYAVVRIRGIRRKGLEAGATNVALTQETVAALLEGAEGNGLWELLLSAGALDLAVDAAIGAQEPAFVVKYAFQLAQSFNNFYHKHHILTEADEQKRAFLLRLTELVEARLVETLGLLGIEAPEKM
ncbi:MAG: arginine--tRNA ligase [Candidatus Acidiferrales bacterium]